MQQIIDQFFDFGIMFDPDNFDYVMKGFWFTIKLAVRPARCDAHALADDKRGTILPFAVATGDGREGRLELPAGDALKADLYAYYAERCGLAGPAA